MGRNVRGMFYNTCLDIFTIMYVYSAISLTVPAELYQPVRVVFVYKTDSDMHCMERHADQGKKTCLLTAFYI